MSGNWNGILNFVLRGASPASSEVDSQDVFSLLGVLERNNVRALTLHYYVRCTLLLFYELYIFMT